ncbi:hypothetical protein QWZ10_01070 [Paracoccus cavernae]|uniref:TonB C-terminal domain-containing protein n=2 Tax=Paracoccus cavernae TaxID=1571207 RepID=A0ABT8D2L2_9RHOB|nr:hypothetical protein [Paracoccus cavernae]
MMPAMRLVLILVLVLTGQTLAAARGQAQIAGEMVLCAGEFTMRVTVDAEGNPVERVTICPDMAPSLMQAVALGADFTPPERAAHAFRPRPLTLSHAEPEAIPAQARDPPFLSAI